MAISESGCGVCRPAPLSPSSVDDERGHEDGPVDRRQIAENEQEGRDTDSQPDSRLERLRRDPTGPASAIRRPDAPARGGTCIEAVEPAP